MPVIIFMDCHGISEKFVNLSFSQNKTTTIIDASTAVDVSPDLLISISMILPTSRG